MGSPRILVFGYGNPSRGDDGLAPALLDLLDGNGCDCLTDFQLQVEHALDLKDRELVLFVDASVSCPTPFQLARLAPARDPSYTTHAVSPSAVLEVYRRLHGEQPPPCYLLSIRGDRFELGEGLSPAALVRLEQAQDLIARLLAEPCAAAWDEVTGETAVA
jgi:hydrogenase maturation protease